MYNLTYKIRTEQGAEIDNTLPLCARHLAELTNIIAGGRTAWGGGAPMFGETWQVKFSPAGECWICRQENLLRDLYPESEKE